MESSANVDDFSRGVVKLIQEVLYPVGTSFIVDRYGRVIEEGDSIVPYVDNTPLSPTVVTQVFRCLDGEMAVITKDRHIRFSDEIEKVQ